MKLSLIAFILSLVSVSASAQIERKSVVITDSAQTSANDNEVDKQSRKERFKELDLTLEQKREMKEIMQANKAAKDAIENNTQLSGEDKKKQLRELQRSQMMKVQAVLTPAQLEKFKASKQNNP
jgi:Spy/CpxP family protein refolding chaperone